MFFTALISLINKIITDSTVCAESWGYFNIKDNGNKLSLVDLNNIKDHLQSNSLSNSLSIKIDNQAIKEADIKVYLDSKTDFNSWEININKQSFLSRYNKGQCIENFFYSLNEFNKWIGGLSPFNPNNPFNSDSQLRIIVQGIDKPIIGKNFHILPVDYNETIPSFKIGYGIPQKNKINDIVHLLTNEERIINPLGFIFQSDSENLIVVETFRKFACLSLAASITNEFYSNSKITIDGISRKKLTLYDNSDYYTTELYNNLLKLVKWIYEDKSLSRQKLFNDRITLELDENKSYISALIIHLDSALNQAIQRYNFVILERKDKYISELKDLLKDIRNQSDLYSQKIRTLLNNLLRDVLAAILLVGFTLFTKFSDNLQLDKGSLLNYVFYALAIYYIISIILQTIVDITDIQISKKEMLYWKKTTKELMPEEDFQRQITESLKGRRCSLRIIYPTIVIFYLCVSYSCYKFPEYFHSISQTKNSNFQNINNQIRNDKIPRYPNQTDSCSSSRK